LLRDDAIELEDANGGPVVVRMTVYIGPEQANRAVLPTRATVLVQLRLASRRVSGGIWPSSVEEAGCRC
jgi:hypothetical protein